MLLVLTSCQQSEYDQLLAKESKSGDTHNSIFDEFELGMSLDSFYDICRAGNADGTYTNSPENWVVREFKQDSTTLQFTFFPGVNDGIIYRMPIDITDKSWAIWNKETHSDKVISKVLTWAESSYGEDFISIENENGQEIFADIDGNREVLIGIKDDKTVSMIVTDYKLDMEIQKTL